MCGDTVMDAKNSEVRKQRGRFLASSDSTCQMPNADRRSSQIFIYSSMCNFRIYSRMSLTYDPDPSIQSWLCRIQSNIIATAFPAHLCLFVTLVFPVNQFFPHRHHFQWHYHRGIHTRGDYISQSENIKQSLLCFFVFPKPWDHSWARSNVIGSVTSFPQIRS